MLRHTGGWSTLMDQTATYGMYNSILSPGLITSVSSCSHLVDKIGIVPIGKPDPQVCQKTEGLLRVLSARPRRGS